VKYVVVHPVFPPTAKPPQTKHSDGTAVSPESEYILFCDARGVEGMKCSVVGEVGTERFTYAPAPTTPARPVTLPVGVLDTTIDLSHPGGPGVPDARASVAPAAAAPTSPPPPPTPPPAPPSTKDSKERTK
jgi:hypothetical protein